MSSVGDGGQADQRRRPVPSVMPACAGIEARSRWMPDHVRQDESVTDGRPPDVKRARHNNWNGAREMV